MISKHYDFLIVGTGLFGATCANLLHAQGYRVLVVDKRNHIGGNCYTKVKNNIMVHWYGAHIFHTSNNKVWNYVNQFATFNNFINSPLAKYHHELYNLPFNMNTFHQLWFVDTPTEAKEKIERETSIYKHVKTTNLEQQALKLVGETIYTKLIKEYTEKQWGRPCSELSPDIIKRIPLRFTYDNNYFNDKYQGIPEEGYTKMIERMLEGCTVRLNYDFKLDGHSHIKYDKLIYTGSLDRLFAYTLGKLDYRSVKFTHKTLYKVEDFQGNAVVNYTSHDVNYTRVIEHKHFARTKSSSTVISYEYPYRCNAEDNPCYPISNEENLTLYKKYRDLIKANKTHFIGGRLGLYKYLDMDKTIEEAMNLVETILHG